MPTLNAVSGFWILCAVCMVGLFARDISLTQPSRVDTQSDMEPEPQYPIVLIGDFGQVTIVHRDYFKHEWIVDDPFDCLKELGLVGGVESPKLDEETE